MNVSRRGFLGGLLASIVAAPELIKEVAKGRSFISLYTPKIFIPSESDIIAFELERVYSRIPDLFERDDTFFKFLEKGKKDIWVSGIDIKIPLVIEPGGKFKVWNV